MSLEKMRRKCQQLTDEESMAILQKATAGTLALLGDNDYPYAVPISYAYREGKQYFHIALAGHKVEAIRKCAKGTCFLFVYPYSAHLPTQKCLKMFPNTSLGVISPPVISARISNTCLRSSARRSPLNCNSSPSVT